MALAQRVPEDRQGLPLERLGLPVFTDAGVHRRQVVQAIGIVAVVVAQRRLADLQGLPMSDSAFA